MGTPYYLEVPAWFPEIEFPGDNELTVERVELGRKIFFEPLLSLDGTISCGSCHHMEEAMADTGALSVGIYGQLGLRNTPSLGNVAYVTPLLRDGGTPTLETQVLAPLSDPLEMAHNIVDAGERLAELPEYNELAQAAYGRDMDYYVITRALAAYERTFISGDSKYDQVMFKGVGSFTTSEMSGMNIFFSDSTNCSDCHTGVLFTNNTFHNNGLYLNYPDSGRARITFLPDDNGKFKVPTLRNVEVTEPYMHDGSLLTLEDVVDHYMSGGQPHVNKSSLINGFTLTPAQKQDLVNFLKTLTDVSFINNEALTSPE